jgi:chemotaxis protein MotB
MKKNPLARRPSRKHEEHTNHEAWAIPYADLLTLLLAFFVVMYAISSVNAGKYRVLSDSLFAAFRGAPRTMQPIQVGEKQVGSGADIQTSIVQQAMLEGQPRSILAVKTDPGSSRVTGNPSVVPKVDVAAKLNGAASAASQALQRVADQVEHAMDDLVKENLVVVRRSEFWIEVEIKTDILFPSGSAHLGTNAVSVIERLADSLAPFPNAIRVEGYTDNIPIKNLQFYSNWELSAARAGSVVRVLSKRGVDPARLAVVGYGDQRPLKPNDTPQGRNANRRVVIVILSTQLQRKTDELPGATAASATLSGEGSAAAGGANVAEGGGAEALADAAARQSAAAAPTTAAVTGAAAASTTAVVPGAAAAPTTAALPGAAAAPTTAALPGAAAAPTTAALPGAAAAPTTAALPDEAATSAAATRTGVAAADAVQPPPVALPNELTQPVRLPGPTTQGESTAQPGAALQRGPVQQPGPSFQRGSMTQPNRGIRRDSTAQPAPNNEPAAPAARPGPAGQRAAPGRPAPAPQAAPAATPPSTVFSGHSQTLHSPAATA